MDRLRPRQGLVFSGFTKAEIEKMEKLSVELMELLPSKEFCKKIAKSFSISSARAGKPNVKWTEVQNWFASRQKENTYKVPSFTDTPENQSPIPETSPPNSEHQSSQTLKGVALEAGEKIPDLSELKFEAKSCKDGAWYDVDMFLTHRFLSSGEAEVRVRFVGYGAEDDEWINVKKAVRERSIPFEHSECNKVAVGDLVLCLQERRDQSIYYDAHVVKIDRKKHDIRGCRCLFLIRYNHDNTEERVRLKKLCYISGQRRK